jgi:hypothetical protein
VSRIFGEIQVYGWPQQLENLLLSTILTGDRALLISHPGAAKTLLPQKLAKVMNVSFAPFDLNAVSFDDILGVLDIPKMQQGEMAYMKAPGTIWGKSFVTYEEINRCKPAIQGKVLEHLRSGTIGGVDTGTRWCWANMNPVGHAGANKLTPAIVDRFSVYVWAPDALSMDTVDRSKIASSMSRSDAPALGDWLKKAGASAGDIVRTQDTTDYKAASIVFEKLMLKASKFWLQIENDMPNLSDFLSLFADSLLQRMTESKDDKSPAPVRLSGRRLAYIRRTIIANRAIELALDSELNVYPTNLRNSMQEAINATIPVGINEEDFPWQTMRTFVNTAIRESYHALDTHSAAEQRLQYDLFCSRDPVERARILISGKITSEEVLNTGWQRISSMNERSADLLAFVAINVDAKLRSSGKNGILPQNVLDSMKRKVRQNHIDPELPKLPGQLIGSIGDINTLIESSMARDPIEGLIAVEAVHEFVSAEPDGNFQRLKRRIEDKQIDFREILAKAVA